jgi:twitching motility protein PilT
MDYLTELNEILAFAIRTQASDVHIKVNARPILRINNILTPLIRRKIITAEAAKKMALSIMKPHQQEKFLKEKDIDFSYSFYDQIHTLNKTFRFRVNAYYQMGEVNIALRSIHANIKSLDKLGLPNMLYDFCDKEQGYFLITGPAGCGKSTTLAALIEYINSNHNKHIITIEDPIEYIFQSKKSFVGQREVGVDTADFHQALKATLRQDPDVIIIGEMRDYTSIAIALTAAETGHLVLSTLHTNNAAQTINRIIDAFPANQQDQVKSQLSTSLLGILSQRLIPKIAGGLIPCYEILINNSAISNLIRQGNVAGILTVIETSAQKGMIPFDRCLLNLVVKEKINFETALNYSFNPDEFKKTFLSKKINK